MYVSVILAILAVVAWSFAIVEYARSSWYTNTDVMGASMVFTFWWIVGVALIVISLVAIGVRSVPWLVATPIAAVVIGKLVEWFVLDPALTWTFKGYRRQPWSPENQPTEKS